MTTDRERLDTWTDEALERLVQHARCGAPTSKSKDILAAFYERYGKPAGLAQPVAPNSKFDILTHISPILKALDNCVELATTDDDKSYWQHEREAVERDFNLLKAQPVAVVGEAMPISDRIVDKLAEWWSGERGSLAARGDVRKLLTKYHRLAKINTSTDHAARPRGK